MAKFFQLVSLALIAAVLAGSQCAELCFFLAYERQATATHPPGPVMPCHQKNETPAKDSQPQHDEQCSHHEMVAEKRSDASSVDNPQSISFVAIRPEAPIIPVHSSSSPLTAADKHFPRISPLVLTSILRI